MRPLATALFLILILIAGAEAQAQFGDVVVYVVFVPDPNIGNGGYNEITIANVGTEPVYAVALGDDLSEVVYTSPPLAGQWSPRRGSRSNWEAGSVFSDYGTYIPPKSNLLDWDVYVGIGFGQVLAWQVTTTGTPVAPGDTLVGLRYLPGAGARAVAPPAVEAPFVAFGSTGDVVAHGLTASFDPVPVDRSNFSRIKSLYR